MTHPLFAAANFAGSIVLFYYSDAFGYAMRDHVGHELMNLHFALTGYIFVLTMIGTDPLPRRAPYPMRLLLLLATMGFHAFFGVAIMGGTGLLAADYFGNLGRTWGPPPSLDQQTGRRRGLGHRRSAHAAGGDRRRRHVVPLRCARDQTHRPGGGQE